MKELGEIKVANILNSVKTIDNVFAAKLEFAMSAREASLTDVRRGLSLLRYLDTDEFTQKAIEYLQRRGIISMIVDVTRNVLVFFPILLTWFSLATAVKAYSNNVNIVSNSEIPFLAQWELGFNGQIANWLRFSNIAMTDAWLVGGIIFLTLLSVIRNSIIDERVVSKALKLQENLNMLIWHLENNLYEKYSSIAASEGENLEALVLQFEKLASSIQNQIDSVLNYLAAEHDRLSRWSEVQVIGLEDIKNASSSFYAAATQLIDMLNEIKGNLTGWTNNLVQQNMTSGEALSRMDVALDYLRLLEEGLGSIGLSIGEKAKSEVNILDELGDSTGRFASAAQSMRVEVVELRSSLSDLGQKITAGGDGTIPQYEKLVSIFERLEMNIQNNIPKINEIALLQVKHIVGLTKILSRLEKIFSESHTSGFRFDGDVVSFPTDQNPIEVKINPKLDNINLEKTDILKNKGGSNYIDRLSHWIHKLIR